MKDVTVHAPNKPGNCGFAKWHLPRSKTDLQALGVHRSLGCACPSPLCPVAAMKRVMFIAREIATTQRKDWKEIPLTPKVCGSALNKKDTAALLSDTAKFLGDAGRITGHSPRVTGAQRMALVGHHVWVVQLFGRWGSVTVLRYVREALLGKEGGNLAEVTENGYNEKLEQARCHWCEHPFYAVEPAMGCVRQPGCVQSIDDTTCIDANTPSLDNSHN